MIKFCKLKPTQIAIDSNGHGVESWRKKAVYKKFHTEDMVSRYHIGQILNVIKGEF